MLFKSAFKRFVVVTLILTIALPSLSIFATAKTTFKNIKVKAEKSVTANLGYAYGKKYSVKIKNIKIAKLSGKIQLENYQAICKIKGIKKGKTTAIVYSNKKKVGSFTINVLRPDAKIISKYKQLTLKHNIHGSTAYMTESHIYLKDMIKNAHPKGKYTISIDNHDVLSNTSDGNIYTVNKGNTKLTVYEKLPKKSIRKLGTVAVKVRDAKMAYVARENKKFYPEGIFGNGNKYECIYTDDKDNTINIQKRIKECLVNNKYTGSAFKKSEYKIKYRAMDETIATVTPTGRVTAINKGITKIKYAIIFSDKSKLVDYCHISVEEHLS